MRVRRPPVYTISAFSMIVAFMASANLARAEASFTGLGDLPGFPFESEAHDVSADGRVVVGSGAVGDGLTEAFRWTAETGLVSIGDLSGGGLQAVAFGVSADGSVVVGSGNGVDGIEAFRWEAGSGMTGLGHLRSVGFRKSVATAVSDDGSRIVGQSTSADGLASHAFLWTSTGGMTSITALDPASGSGFAWGISGDGQLVAGERSTASGVEAFRWSSDAGVEGLGELVGGGYSSQGFGISSDGAVVVGQSTSTASGPHSSEAFRWNGASGMIGLGGEVVVDRVISRAYDASADGSVVVGTQNSKAFIWDATHGMRDLKDVLEAQGVDLAGWRLIAATAVSADGTTIVGTADNPDADGEAWIARIEPIGPAVGPVVTPPFLTLLLTGLVAVAYAALRRKPATAPMRG